MSQLAVDRLIRIPAPRVWAALADFQGVHRFHPRIERAELLTPQSCGVGAERECRMYGGRDHVRERIVEWQEGRSLAVTILDSTLPIASAWARISVEPAGDRSLVSFEMRYLPKYGLLGRIADALFMRRMMRKMGRELLFGLERHLRTGAVVGRHGLLHIAGARAET